MPPQSLLLPADCRDMHVVDQPLQEYSVSHEMQQLQIHKPEDVMIPLVWLAHHRSQVALHQQWLRVSTLEGTCSQNRNTWQGWL